MSKYKIIWETLKKDKVITLKVQPKWHKRIIKAISRIKDEDVGFKLESAERNKKYRLKYKVKEVEIKINLIESFDIKNISEEDL